MPSEWTCEVKQHPEAVHKPKCLFVITHELASSEISWEYVWGVVKQFFIPISVRTGNVIYLLAFMQFDFIVISVQLIFLLNKAAPVL